MKRKKATPEEVERRTHRAQVRATFRNAGFEKVLSVSDKEFEFKERKGDFDDIFIYENIIVLAEYTCAKSGNLSRHILPKKILFDKVDRKSVV